MDALLVAAPALVDWVYYKLTWAFWLFVIALRRHVPFAICREAAELETKSETTTMVCKSGKP